MGFSLQTTKKDGGEADKRSTAVLDVVNSLKLPVLDAKDSRVVQAEAEAFLDPYEVIPTIFYHQP